MATSQSSIFCGPCSRDNEDSQVAQWCTDCKEGLCQSCTKHHRRSLASCKHYLIDKDDISDVLPVLQGLPETCLSHENQPLTWFCKVHDVICCSSCKLNEHSKCSDVISIEEASNDVDKSAALLQIKDRLNKTKTYVNDLVKEVNKNETDIDKQKKYIENQISDFRKTLNDRLDLMESNTRSQLNSICGTIKEIAQKVSRRLDDQLKTNEIMIQHLSILEQKGSKAQLFRMIKDLDMKQTEEEKESWQTVKDFDVTSLRLQHNKALNKVIEPFSFLCDVIINFGQKLNPTSNHLSSQIQVETLNKYPPNLTDTKVLNVDSIVKGLEVIRCCFLDENRYLLGCASRIVIVCDNSFNKLGRVRVNSDIQYASAISESIAALTTYTGFVHLIDTNKNKSIKCIKLGSNCSGVTRFKSSLLVCVDKKLTIMNHNLEDVRTINHEGTATIVTCNDCDSIFYCDFYNCRMLWCILSDGSLIFKTELTNFDSPTSIAIDKYSRLYIASVKRSSVKCVSSDGKTQHDLLSGVLSTPTSIAISGQNMVIIDDWRRKIRLYSLG